jgi:hypothetical protein
MIARTRKSKRSSKSVKNKTMKGGRISVPANPPGFVPQPWYHLVVRIPDMSAQYTSIQLQAALATQLGVSFTNAVVNVRLLSVRFWGALPGGSSAQTTLEPLSVIVLDPLQAAFSPVAPVTTPASRILETLIDYPDRVNRASVGYTYPPAQREVSMNINGTDPISLFRSIGMGENSVAYVNLLWRQGSLTVVRPSQAVDEVDQLADRIARDSLIVDDSGIIRSESRYD